jgi:hypothetical protein
MPQSSKATLIEVNARLQANVGLELFPPDSWFLVIPPSNELPPPLVWTPVNGYPTAHTGPLDFKSFQDEDIRNLPNYALPGAVVIPLAKAFRNLHLTVLRSAIIVGRGSFADVRFSSPEISKKHASLTKNDDGYWMVQDTSTNGTFLNGRRLEAERDARVFPNDEICFASIRSVLVNIKGLNTLCKLMDSSEFDDESSDVCDLLEESPQGCNNPTARFHKPVGFVL